MKTILPQITQNTNLPCNGKQIKGRFFLDDQINILTLLWKQKGVGLNPAGITKVTLKRLYIRPFYFFGGLLGGK